MSSSFSQQLVSTRFLSISLQYEGTVNYLDMNDTSHDTVGRVTGVTITGKI